MRPVPHPASSVIEFWDPMNLRSSRTRCEWNSFSNPRGSATQSYFSPLRSYPNTSVPTTRRFHRAVRVVVEVARHDHDDQNDRDDKKNPEPARDPAFLPEAVDALDAVVLVRGRDNARLHLRFLLPCEDRQRLR